MNQRRVIVVLVATVVILVCGLLVLPTVADIVKVRQAETETDRVEAETAQVEAETDREVVRGFLKALSGDRELIQDLLRALDKDRELIRELAEMKDAGTWFKGAFYALLIRELVGLFARLAEKRGKHQVVVLPQASASGLISAPTMPYLDETIPEQERIHLQVRR